MSSLDDNDTPPLSFQKAEISSVLNSVVMYVFLMGIYTIAFGITFFLYVRRQDSSRWIIVGAISVMYISSIASSALYWSQLDFAILGSGTTMLDTFNAVYYSPLWFFAVNDLLENLVIAIADGLLMWRCYVVWNGTRRVVWAPCGLWVVEVGLAITDTVVDFYNLGRSDDDQICIGGQISSAQFFTSAATSLVATYLIAHRIYTASRQSGSSKKLFRNVINIVMESAAVYTLCVIALGILCAIPEPDSDTAGLALDTATNYSGSVVWALIGLTPTLMVMRVALSTGKNNVSVSTLDMPSKMFFQSRGSAFRQSWNSVYGDRSFRDGYWKKGGSEVV